MVLIITEKQMATVVSASIPDPRQIMFSWFSCGLISRGFLEVIQLATPSSLVRICCVLNIEYPVHL
jgi:hypothetical protein